MADIKTEPVEIKAEAAESTEVDKMEQTADENTNVGKPNELEAKIIRQVEVILWTQPSLQIINMLNIG